MNTSPTSPNSARFTESHWLNEYEAMHARTATSPQPQIFTRYGTPVTIQSAISAPGNVWVQVVYPNLIVREHALADLRASGGLGEIVDEIRRVSPFAISSL